ncbi:VOC family protein [Sphingomonas sp. BK580]|uniref:VOC family protein n=1 Tax=Sphingomonas sp. BK580 TaxID=2586972 RepID=UPI00160B9971|nr:VOC family protein [Sphingomonas sp. BK580]MBB3695233.1 glyoxylase I family protein [Sphingomonas sp. BK580]
MRNQGIGYYTIRVPSSDLDKIADFYIGIVGLENGSRPDSNVEGRWLYAGGKDVLHIEADNDLVSAETSIAHSISHVSFQCTGLDEAVEHLNSSHVSFDLVGTNAVGVAQVFLRDPEGRGVELNFNP